MSRQNRNQSEEHIVTYSGSSSRWNFIALQKSIHYSQTQPATPRSHVHVRPARSRNTHSYRILPTGPLVAIFQHSLPSVQSESFQTHGTIHHRAIDPLALHNGTSAYTSLTRHLPAPTIECLHRPPYKLTCFRPTSTRSRIQLTSSFQVPFISPRHIHSNARPLLRS
jgi:hypothetical protein